MITTNNNKLFKKMKSYRQYGFKEIIRLFLIKKVQIIK